MLPETGEGEGPAIGARDLMGLLASLDARPFIVAIGRNQTAPAAHRMLERGLLQNRLDARIGQRLAWCHFLRPGRNEAPAHQSQVARLPVGTHDGDGAAWRYVGARRKIMLLHVLKELAQMVGPGFQPEEIAHVPLLSEAPESVKARDAFSPEDRSASSSAPRPRALKPRRDPRHWRP